MMRALVLALALFLASCKPEGTPIAEGPVDLVIAITGLGSSAPGAGEIWRAWAKDATGRVEDIPGVETMIVSADGRLELVARDRILTLHTQGRLDSLSIITHSNGFRDGLYMAEWAERESIPVDYFAGIDMTLGPGRAVVTCGIKRFDEFHAALRRASWAAGCTPEQMRYRYKKVRMGHTAAANSEIVQAIIHEALKETFDANRTD